MFSAIKKYIYLPAEEKRLFYQALRIAVRFRLYTLIYSSKRLTGILGIPHKDSLFDADITKSNVIHMVCRAMRRSTIYLPFRRKCLVEAFVVKKMLEKYNISTTIYLGVAKDDNKNLIAHAWLRYGNNIIVGRKGMNRYKSLERFT
jgi:hypothetical protein